jgi:predicted nucleotidyltransferase
VFQYLLKKLASALSKKKIPYMIIGGQAVLIYGEPRLTKDIDVTLGIGLEGLPKIKAMVKSLDLKSLVSDIDRFVKETMVFPVIDEKSGIRVDFILSYSPYERQAIERAGNIAMGRTKVKFAALEDVVIHKMIAGRPRDMEDIRIILLKNPGYDPDYIEKWLMEFDLSLGKKYLNEFRTIKKKLKTD